MASYLDWHLKAPMDRKVNGDSAFFSAEREGDLAEFLELDSKVKSQNRRSLMRMHVT